MPRINITENDNSWYTPQVDSNDLVIYAPGFSTFGPDEPTLVNSETFSTIFGEKLSQVDDISSYDMVTSYLLSGALVLFHRLIPNGALKSSIEVPGVTRTAECSREGVTIEIAKVYKENINTVFTYSESGNNWTDQLSGKEFDNAKLKEKYGLTITLDDDVALENGDTITFTVTASPAIITVTAKYPGSFGNQLSFKPIRVSKDDTTGVIDGYIHVILKGAVIEIITIRDLAKGDYSSNYLTLELTGNEVPEDFNNTTFSLVGGQDYVAPSTNKSVKTEALEAFIRKNYEKGLDIKDPLFYDLDAITTNGLDGTLTVTPNDSTGTSISLDSQFKDVVESRKDCIFIVDDPNDNTNYDVDGDGSADFYAYCGQFDSVRCVGIGPRSASNLITTGRSTTIPGSFVFLYEWSKSIASGNPKWRVPAGVKYGSLGTVTDTVYKIGSAQLAIWQNNDQLIDGGHKVNPIMQLKNYGYVIYGDSTLKHSQANGATSMLQQISVVTTINAIHRRAHEIALGLQFDQMDSSLILEFKTLLSTFMDTLKYQSAIYAYDITVGVNNTVTATMLTTKTIPVIVNISPTPAVENFDITLNVTQAGVTFSTEE